MLLKEQAIQEGQGSKSPTSQHNIQPSQLGNESLDNVVTLRLATWRSMGS